MAPPEAQVEWQTREIINCLFEDDHIVSLRCIPVRLDASLTDGPAGSDDHFDPVVIADKLRTVADTLNDDLTFKAALADLKKAAAQEAVEAAFSHGVEALCKTQVSQRAEVSPEMQLIRASAAFGLYVVKSSPELKDRVKSAMDAFLNQRVRSWVIKQGGWDKVHIED
ncbi:bcl-2-like protein 15 [Chaetodon trifascialis]|uniref:bcl-2-like protein 15 n=1 Tax=Chaetodon trifascialis TaxID=109706 RepID=UPI003994A621